MEENQSSEDNDEATQRDPNGTDRTANKTVQSKKRHPVHEYFDYCPTEKLSKCKFEDCPTSLSGINTTNLMFHLERKHPNVYAEVISNVSKKQKNKSLAPIVKYSSNHPRQKKLTTNLAMWIATNSTVPVNVVEQKEFRKVLLDLDPSFNVPTRMTINKTMYSLWQDLEEKIRVILDRQDEIAISGDIWTKPGQTSSFLGTSTTFYDKLTKEKLNLHLDSTYIESATHTSTDILNQFETVLQKYNLPKEKIWFTCTDSGSNMLKAFKNLNSETLNEEVEDGKSLLPDENEIEDEPRTTPIFYAHQACFIHTILLCLKPFYLVPTFNTVVKKTRSIAKIFSKSHVMTKVLFDGTGLKIVQFSKARWNIVYIFVRRFIDLQGKLNSVLKAGGYPEYEITEKEWESLASIETFLKPFYIHTTMSQSTSTTYFSEATLILKEFEEHLQTYKKSDILGLDICADKIMNEIKKRINRYYSERSEQSTSIQISNRTFALYLAATFLDPRYRQVILKDQRELFIATQCLVKLLPSTSAPTAELVLNPPPEEKSKYAYVAAKYPRPHNVYQSTGINSKFDAEIAAYIDCKLIENSQSSPFEFWEKHSLVFPILSSLAFKILALPMNTADLEQSFSFGGISTGGRRNRLDKDHLSLEIFMCKNKHLM